MSATKPLAVLLAALVVTTGVGAAAGGTLGSSAAYAMDAQLDAGDVTVTVTHGGEAVQNASVFVDGESVGTTSADGTVTFDAPEDDDFEVTVEGDGFELTNEYAAVDGSLTPQESELEVGADAEQNADDGEQNADDGDEHADDNADDGEQNSDDGEQNADDNADDGEQNADDREDNADDDANVSVDADAEAEANAEANAADGDDANGSANASAGASADAETDANGQRGPPASLPSQASDRASAVTDVIGSFLSGSIGNLGHAISGLAGSAN